MSIERLMRAGVIVLCGSDGVGKTTTSAALATHAAIHYELRVAVLTIDPARRLANAMGLPRLSNRLRAVPLPGAGAAPAKGTLHAGMLETKSAWDDLIVAQAGGRAKAAPILANPFYQEISGAFIGSHEYIAMERLYDLWQSAKYDLIVLDTPPSRNALDFLEAPARMTELVGGGLLGLLAHPGAVGRVGLRLFSLTTKPLLRMADRLLGASTLSELSEFLLSVEGLYEGFKQRADAVYGLLTDRTTSFVIVTTLEDVPFGEARFFAEKLREAGMGLRGTIVNKLLPKSLLDPHATRLATQLAGEEDELLCALGANFLAYRTLAQRDQDLLGRIDELKVPLLAAVPRMAEPVNDLSGLLEVGDLMAHPPRWA